MYKFYPGNSHSRSGTGLSVTSPGPSKYGQGLLVRPEEWLSVLPYFGFHYSWLSNTNLWVRDLRPHLRERENRLLATSMAKKEGVNSPKSTFPTTLLFIIYVKSSHFCFSLAIFWEFCPSSRLWLSLSLSPYVLRPVPFPYCLCSHLSESLEKQGKKHRWTRILKSGSAKLDTDVSGPRSVTPILIRSLSSSVINSTGDWGLISATYKLCDLGWCM